MELQLNEKKVCEVEAVFDSGQHEVVLQCGQLSPLDKRKVFDVFVPVEPVVALGVHFSLVEGDQRIPIDILKVVALPGRYLLKVVAHT